MHPKGCIGTVQPHPSSCTQHSGGSQKASPLWKATDMFVCTSGSGWVLEQKILTSTNSRTSSLELRCQLHTRPWCGISWLPSCCVFHIHLLPFQTEQISTAPSHMLGYWWLPVRVLGGIFWKGLWKAMLVGQGGGALMPNSGLSPILGVMPQLQEGEHFKDKK